MAKNSRPKAEPQRDSSSSEEGSSSEGGSSSEESQQDNNTSTKIPAPRKPQPTSSQHSSSSEDSESEDESKSESKSDSPPTTARRHDLNIKPITSKPMEDTPKSTKKPRSEPTSATPASKPTAAVKRRAADSVSNGGDRETKKAKKKKKKKDEGVVNDDTTAKKNGEDSRKQFFQRLWSEDDEIVILKGLMEYRENKGADPTADLNAFQDFIKKSLHMGDFSKSQFSTKVRRLKKKFENNVKKAKNGQDRSFSNAHEQRIYDLCKKIWGSEANNVVEVENGKGGKNQKVLPKVDELVFSDGIVRGMVELNTGAKRALRFDETIGGPSLEAAILEDGLELIGGSKKLELKEKWRQYRIEEVELYVKRADLVSEHAKLVLEALKSKFGVDA